MHGLTNDATTYRNLSAFLAARAKRTTRKPPAAMEPPAMPPFCDGDNLPALNSWLLPDVSDAFESSPMVELGVGEASGFCVRCISRGV